MTHREFKLPVLYVATLEEVMLELGAGPCDLPVVTERDYELIEARLNRVYDEYVTRNPGKHEVPDIEHFVRAALYDELRELVIQKMKSYADRISGVVDRLDVDSRWTQ